jgi:hypothetical protein
MQYLLHNLFQVAILFSDKIITSDNAIGFLWPLKSNSIEDQKIHVKPYQYTSRSFKSP